MYMLLHVISVKPNGIKTVFIEPVPSADRDVVTNSSARKSSSNLRHCKSVTMQEAVY